MQLGNGFVTEPQKELVYEAQIKAIFLDSAVPSLCSQSRRKETNIKQCPMKTVTREYPMALFSGHLRPRPKRQKRWNVEIMESEKQISF